MPSDSFPILLTIETIYDNVRGFLVIVCYLPPFLTCLLLKGSFKKTRLDVESHCLLKHLRSSGQSCSLSLCLFIWSLFMMEYEGVPLALEKLTVQPPCIKYCNVVFLFCFVFFTISSIPNTLLMLNPRAWYLWCLTRKLWTARLACSRN